MGEGEDRFWITLECGKYCTGAETAICIAVVELYCCLGS
jgi:hypothetical protein